MKKILKYVKIFTKSKYLPVTDIGEEAIHFHGNTRFSFVSIAGRRLFKKMASEIKLEYIQSTKHPFSRKLNSLWFRKSSCMKKRSSFNLIFLCQFTSMESIY